MAGITGQRARTLPRKTAGLTLMEITFSILIIGMLLLASAGAFTTAIGTTEQAKRTTGAAIFLETTMEGVSAQPFPNLLTLNGNQIFDGTSPADSNYRVDLTVFLAELNLLQVGAVITDLRTGRQIGRLSTQRSDR